MTNKERQTLREAADLILSATNMGENVVIRGFGTFKRTTRSARTARNPMTGDPIQVPEKSVLLFKASKQTTEEV